MAKKKKQPKIPVDTFSEKSARGRRRVVPSNWVLGTAENYYVQFSSVWDRIGEQLIAAKSPEEVLNALNSAEGMISIPPGIERFAELVFKIKTDPGFPRVRKKSQIHFLSDSLGANGVLTPRRSRDVCAEERAKAKRANHIIRYEYYVECSCGYKGLSQNRACAVCRAPIFPMNLQEPTY